MNKESFREEVRAAIRHHDPDADDLRSLSNDLLSLADRYEKMEAEI